MYILEPDKNDWLSGANIINLYKKIVNKNVKRDDIVIQKDNNNDFEICIEWTCIQVFHAYVNRFDESYKDGIMRTLLILYWNLYGQVSLDIPVYYRLSKYNHIYDNEYIELENQTYGDPVDMLKKYIIQPFISINYSNKYSKIKEEDYQYVFKINPFWTTVALYKFIYIYKNPNITGSIVKLETFPIIDWLGINPKKINKNNIKLVKKLILVKNVKFSDIMDIDMIDDPKYVTTILRETLLFDSCVYNKSNNNYSIVGSLNLSDIIKENKNTKVYKGFYKYDDDIYNIDGSISTLISTRSGSNYIPFELFNSIPFIKERYQENSPEKVLFNSPLPTSPGSIMSKLSLFSNLNGIFIHRINIQNNSQKVKEGDIILLEELVNLYPDIFSGVVYLDPKTKRKWDINYITEYDKNFILKFLISFTSLNSRYMFNTVENQLLINKNYTGEYKKHTKQNKKLTDFGRGVATLSFLSDMYKFGYTRKHQKCESQPKFTHPYSLWLQVYDAGNPIIDNTLDITFFDNLLRFVYLKSHFENTPYQIKILHPWLYENIMILRSYIQKNDIEMMYIHIFRLFKVYKSIDLNFYNKKLYWICINLLYKKYANWLIDGEGYSTHYEQAHTIGTIYDYIYYKLYNDNLINENNKNLWENEFGIDIDDHVEFDNNHILSIFPLIGQGTINKVKPGFELSASSNIDIVGMQIPIVPILLPGINPIKDNNIVKDYDIYKYMINTLGNIKFPIISDIYKGSEKYIYWPSIYLPPIIKIYETSYNNGYNVVFSSGRESKKSPIGCIKLIQKIQENRESKSGSITYINVNGINLMNIHIIREPDYIPIQIIHLLCNNEYKYIYMNHPFSDKTLKFIKLYIVKNMDKNTPIYRNLPIDFKYILEIDTIDYNYTNMYLYYAYLIRFYKHFNFTKNINFKDDIKGLNIIKKLNYNKHDWNIKSIVRDYFNIFEKHNIKVNITDEFFSIQNEYYDTNDTSSMEIKQFYDFIKSISFDINPPKFINSWFDQVKQFNMFNHIRYIEYITKTNIILLYNRDDDYFVFNQKNYYINPRYKYISFMFILNREKTLLTTENKIYLKSLNNQQKLLYRNESNAGSWANRDWYISPIMFKGNYIHIDEYLKNKDFKLYDDIIGVINRKETNKTFKGSHSLDAFLTNKLKKIKVYSKINRVKSKAKFKVSYENDRIRYSVDIDPTDPIKDIIKQTLNRFQIADDNSKDIGFLDEDGFIKTWVIGNDIFTGNRFSTHISCKRIIRIEFIRKVINEDKYIFYNNNSITNFNNFMKMFPNANFKSQRLNSRIMMNIINKDMMKRVSSMLNIKDDSDNFKSPFNIILPKLI